MASSGQPAWVLISQVDHAHLAARVAEVWGEDPFAPLSPRSEVLAGIEHHDDGWATWERHPAVDPRSGRPLDFTEVPLEVSLPIWQGSIDAAARHGALAAAMVAEHFTALLRRFNARWSHLPASVELAEKFFARQEAMTAGWLAEWQKSHHATVAEAAATAARALAELKWFDLLSLWLCCAVRTDAVEFDTPSHKLTMTPRAEDRFVLSPWPLTVPRLELSVGGRQVAASHYATADDLAAAPSSHVKINWLLSPD